MSHGGEKKQAGGGRSCRMEEARPSGGKRADGEARTSSGEGEGLGGGSCQPRPARPALTSIRRSRLCDPVPTPGSAGWRRGQLPAAMTGAGLAAGGLGRTCGQRPSRPPWTPARPPGRRPSPRRPQRGPACPDPHPTTLTPAERRRRRHVLTAARGLSGFAMTEAPPPPPTRPRLTRAAGRAGAASGDHPDDKNPPPPLPTS